MVVESVPSSQWWVGILLEVAATFASTLGKELFRLAAKKGEPLPLQSDGSIAPNRRLWPYYVVAVACAMLVSPGLEAAAFSFTAQSILSACAGLVLLWNIVLAPFVLSEKITLARFGSAAVIMIGTAGVGFSGNHREQRVFDSEEWGRILTRGLAVAYYTMFVGWIIILCYLYKG